MSHITVSNGAWVLVADGCRALLLYNHGDPDLIDLRVIEARVEKDPPTREQGSDAPGRAFSSAGSGGRSSVESTNWHEIQKEQFAARIAERINEAAANGEMKAIAIIAPPRVLGELRAELSAEARSMVIGEIGKDLTHHPLPEIEKALAREFARTM